MARGEASYDLQNAMEEMEAANAFESSRESLQKVRRLMRDVWDDGEDEDDVKVEEEYWEDDLSDVKKEEAADDEGHPLSGGAYVDLCDDGETISESDAVAYAKEEEAKDESERCDSGEDVSESDAVASAEAAEEATKEENLGDEDESDEYDPFPHIKTEKPWEREAKTQLNAEFRLLRETLGEHPWAVRPHQRGKATDLTESERTRLRLEQGTAEIEGTPWSQRGPAQTYDEDGLPETQNWRGQPFRKGLYGGKQRYAKRGGKNQSYYAELNKLGMLKPGKHGATTVPEGKAFAHKGKGKGKPTSSSSSQSWWAEI